MARHVRRGGPPEVRLVAARHDPDLERRARGVRRERDAVVVLPDQAVRSRGLLADEPAERALPFADDEARRAAQLLGDPVRDLGQVVQVQAQVVRPGAGLRAPVLDDLEVVGLAGGPRLGQRVAGAADERLDERRCRRRGAAGARPGGATIVRQLPGRAGLGQRDLGEAAVELAGVVAGADDVEGEVLEHPDADAVALRACEQFAQPNRRSSIGSAARANRSRWKARSTIVATHQPVIGSLRSSNRPAATASGPRPAAAPSSAAKAVAKIRPARSTDARGRRRAGVAQLARDRGRGDAGHPARVDQVEVGQVDASR